MTGNGDGVNRRPLVYKKLHDTYSINDYDNTDVWAGNMLLLAGGHEFGTPLARLFLDTDDPEAVETVRVSAEIYIRGVTDTQALDDTEVDVTLWTHAVGGLSENDFILAAKIDAILA